MFILTFTLYVHSVLHTPSLNQLILSKFIAEDYLERHIMKMKKIYKNRRDFLIQQLKSTFSNTINIFGYFTVLHLIVEFNQVQFTKELLEKIQQLGVKVYPVEDHAIEKGKHYNRIIIGYGHLTTAEIKEGVSRLQRVILRIYILVSK
ncbi:GntR family transcriptional regulator [Bacillus thuringiensis]|nr:GntR family transcriptional regulator [Bacillus thuringiensis]MED2150636.1 GntR family transcriptional regulator [Bacillus thuringiensis]MED2479330.1 hypothetical protein [Bacillus thuringiensis]MED2578709.1 GntR family transcriptional regulator [Bacillus thuringiensis]